MTGFTGVIWDARTSRDLAGALGDGPGAAPFADAASSWGSLAAELANAAVEYAAVLARLRTQWQSGSADAALDRLGALTRWFAEMAAQATAAAAATETQAVAVTVARLAMPNVAEIDLIGDLAHAASVTASMIPLATGAAAHAERAAHDQRIRAARVMEAYEAAAEPLARPWRAADPAPKLVADAAAVSPPSSSNAGHGGGEWPTAAGAPGVATGIVSVSSAPRGSYAPTTLASAPATSPEVPLAPQNTAPAPSNHPVPPPLAPTAMPAGERTLHRAEPPDNNVEAVVAQRVPESWAELAIGAHPVVAHHGLDAAYVRQTLTLDTGDPS